LPRRRSSPLAGSRVLVAAFVSADPEADTRGDDPPSGNPATRGCFRYSIDPAGCGSSVGATTENLRWIASMLGRLIRHPLTMLVVVFATIALLDLVWSFQTDCGLSLKSKAE
jgi:hypothetical protein